MAEETPPGARWTRLSRLRAAFKGSSELSPQLERTLMRYLELRIQELESSEVERKESGERGELTAAIGQMLTRVSVLAVYALAIATAFQSVLIAALLNPQEVASRVKAAVSSLTIINSIPPAFQGTVVAALGALALLAFRSTPLGVRANIVGPLFMGVIALSILSLSAAAAAGAVGMLAALPGFVAAVVIVYEFGLVLERTLQGQPDRAPAARTVDSRFTRQAAMVLNWLGSRVRVTESRAALFVFLGVPAVIIAVVVAAVLTNGGPLYWPSWIAQRAFPVWCVWAFAVTPKVVRIPLWSLLIWAALFLTLFFGTAVANIYALAILTTLLGNVMLAVLRSGRQRPRASVV